MYAPSFVTNGGDLGGKLEATYCSNTLFYNFVANRADTWIRPYIFCAIPVLMEMKKIFINMLALIP